MFNGQPPPSELIAWNAFSRLDSWVSVEFWQALGRTVMLGGVTALIAVAAGVFVAKGSAQHIRQVTEAIVDAALAGATPESDWITNGQT